MKADKHSYPSVHRGIVRAAMRLLEQKNTEASAFYKVSDLEVMVESAAYPDRIGDRQQGSGLHYYIAVSPNGTPTVSNTDGFYPNGKGKYAPSPRTMFQSELYMAMVLCSNRKQQAGMESLSRAVHMIADICCPPHATGLSYLSRYGVNHKRYEATAAEYFWGNLAELDEDIVAKKWAEMAAGDIPYDTFCAITEHLASHDSVCDAEITQVFRRIADESAKDLHIALGEDISAIEKSVKSRVIEAIRNAAALLGAFAFVSMQHGVVSLREACPYRVLSAETRFSLVHEPLYLHFGDDGSFTLSSQDGRNLTVSPLGNVMLMENSNSVNAKFRLGFEPQPVIYVGNDMNRVLGLKNKRLHCFDRRFYFYSDQYFQKDTKLILSE